MAATATAESVDAAIAAVAEPPAKRRSGKKLVMLIVLPLLVIGLVAGGLIFTGIVKLGGEEHAEGEAPAKPEEPKTYTFFDLPDLLVNLSSTGKRTNYLKIKVALELAKPEDAAVLQTLAPRVIDNFQIYLRELRVEDLRGSAGLYRLREELLARVNNAAQPARVNDVLFKEMLVQ